MLCNINTKQKRQDKHRPHTNTQESKLKTITFLDFTIVTLRILNNSTNLPPKEKLDYFLKVYFFSYYR